MLGPLEVRILNIIHHDLYDNCTVDMMTNKISSLRYSMQVLDASRCANHIHPNMECLILINLVWLDLWI